MFKTQRHEQILKYLDEFNLLTIKKAIELLGASEPTVRRDFNFLSKKNMAKRFRGGLQSLQETPNQMVPFAIRQLKQSVEKESIAKEAIRLLKPGDVIFVDGGTTTFHLGLVLPNIELRVITNSLRLAAILEERTELNPSLEVSITGGLLYRKSGILLGPNTEKGISQYHADFAFISAGGVNENGIYNTNELVTETERVMISNADQTVVLADHSKIGKKAMCHVCGLDQINILITDASSSNDAVLAKIQDSGVKVLKTNAI